MKDEEDFKEALKNKKIPILILDQKWHRLFALYGKNDEVRILEKTMNELLARQGKLNSDIKDMKKLKATLMQNIVENMDGTAEDTKNPILSKKLEEDKRLINEINEKLELAEDELLDIPNLLKEKNEELMTATMDFCYEKLRDNKQQADDIAEWIKQIRIELKRNIIKKQNCEINNKEMYAYMHDIFGAQVIDIFDVSYEEKENVPPEEEKKE